jgi:hypothetical protein
MLLQVEAGMQGRKDCKTSEQSRKRHQLSVSARRGSEGSCDTLQGILGFPRKQEELHQSLISIIIIRSKNFNLGILPSSRSACSC